MTVAAEYAIERGRKLTRFLGDGNDGAVWESNSHTAVKAVERHDSYLRERDAYFRLCDNGIYEIHGFAVPYLVDHDDTRQVVEMTVVFPPCIIDFAKAYVDRPPDFTPEILRDWREDESKLFDDDWDKVEELLASLREIGIFYFDAKPGNIRFQNWYSPHLLNETSISSVRILKLNLYDQNRLSMVGVWSSVQSVTSAVRVAGLAK